MTTYSDGQEPIALVIGAGRRFGAHLSLRLAGAGYIVLMTARHSFHEAIDLSAVIRSQGGRAVVFRSAADTQSNASVIARWAEEQCAKMRPEKAGLDLLVCNASIYRPTPIDQAIPSDAQSILGSNLLGPFWLVQACLPMLRTAKGCVVAVADAQIDRAMPQYALYHAAKLGLRGMMQSLAVECAPDVRINTVSPGVMPWPDGTPEDHRRATLSTIPAGREGTWDDLSQAVLMMAQAPYCVGADLRVDGGWSRV